MRMCAVDSIIFKAYPNFQTSVAEQIGLCLTCSETPETGFLETRLIFILLLSAG